jgi:hypothetical protein
VSRGVLAIASMVAACWSASAAELTTFAKENKTIVVLKGELAQGDASRFEGIVKSSSAGGKPVGAIRLDSPGGSIREGVRLAAVIDKNKITTVIIAGAICTRECFIPFIAGRQKVASATATVSVPGAAENSDRQPATGTPDVAQVEKTPELVKVVQKLGLLDAIVAKMLATPENQSFPLTVDDLRAMGATITGRLTQPR